MTTVAEAVGKIGAELHELEMQMRNADLGRHACDILASARGRLQQLAQHPDAAAKLADVKKDADAKIKLDADAAKNIEKAAADAKTKLAADKAAYEKNEKAAAKANAPFMFGAASPKGFNWPAGTGPRPATDKSGG